MALVTNAPDTSVRNLLASLFNNAFFCILYVHTGSRGVEKDLLAFDFSTLFSLQFGVSDEHLLTCILHRKFLP